MEYVFTLWGMIIVAVVCSSLATIAGVVAKQWRKSREAEMEASVKIELIRQGRSADEIERVLKMTGKTAVGDDDAD